MFVETGFNNRLKTIRKPHASYFPYEYDDIVEYFKLLKTENLMEY